ncbi:nitrogen fixation NifU-like protein [Halorubrum alkaliphilum]|uniref:Nitrogen fixation NifU-like protein n=1 Tax=Halorubrum alkaliphilum TaxID=261290 RepID=A0A8T4GHF3_9EURY|nr:iron-sulfur cluster assembly scaffold protein [Halorubrum alkaliphilum]MBP1923994.1 nitrogen fixation NifU-like protein [Halorubrum alkaliphilum]
MEEKFIRELLADHSRNPQNYGRLADPDAKHETSNPQCVGPTHPEGDEVTLTVELSNETPPVIETAQFTGRGCTLSQATASLLTEEMIGSSVAEVADWDSETLENLVGMDLTPSRLKCAELALVAVRNAVESR